jgi:hypothetical protein
VAVSGRLVRKGLRAEWALPAELYVESSKAVEFGPHIGALLWLADELAMPTSRIMLTTLLLIAMTTTPTTTSAVLLEEDFKTLDRWHLEGRSEGVSINDGQLRLACEGSQQGAVGTMAFLKESFPDHIAIEYDLVVENHDGLLITFIAMTGLKGEDAITEAPKRKGIFPDYSDGTRSYHVSICRYDDDGKHTGVSNWRRNPGLNLMVSGKDWCTATGKTYRVRITKRGRHCRVEVDGKVGAEFTDPQTLPGPIPAGGKVGFRAIGSKAIFRIANLKIAALPAEK